VPEHVLASLGYAAVCVDLGASVIRPAPGFKMTPVTADLSALDFFENAVEVLSDAQLADPARVALSGFSASSTHIAFALTQSDRFTAAIVTTGGSFDAISCYLAANYRSCERRARQEGFERPYDSRNGILKDSPAWNAEKIRTPLLMQLPEAEYTGMMQLYGALMEYDRAVEMYVFADAFHYKHDPRQRLTVYDRNIEWIDFWLKGAASSRPDHAAQNSRWRGMRDGQCALPPNEASGGMWYCSPQ
jgi:dipeptidyl aminopeptidase/acylaminoacyl peptidase